MQGTISFKVRFLLTRRVESHCLVQRARGEKRQRRLVQGIRDGVVVRLKAIEVPDRVASPHRQN